MTSDQENKVLEVLMEFKDQYDLDMRGDTKVTNGSKGVINEVREIKETLTTYPSITWLWANKPGKTIATVLGVLTVFQILWYFGLIGAVGSLIGIDLKEIAEIAKTVTPIP